MGAGETKWANWLPPLITPLAHPGPFWLLNKRCSLWNPVSSISPLVKWACEQSALAVAQALWTVNSVAGQTCYADLPSGSTFPSCCFLLLSAVTHTASGPVPCSLRVSRACCFLLRLQPGQKPWLSCLSVRPLLHTCFPLGLSISVSGNPTPLVVQAKHLSRPWFVLLLLFINDVPTSSIGVT